MYLAYLDESGDHGTVSGSSAWFVLSCVLVHDQKWLATLDQLIVLRRNLHQHWGLPARTELKAQHFRWGHGPFEEHKTGLRDRMNIYKDVMEYQAAQLAVRVFTIAIAKARLRSPDARTWAWTMALQRIDKFCQVQDERAMIFPDAGHAPFIRKLLRKVRRIQVIKGHYGGKIEIPAKRIVEDPNDRHSQDSYLIQLADWNAYAALRSPYLEPRKKVRQDLWDRLAPLIVKEVNSVAGGPPGIVVWPRI
ncbi:MAG: DUF3800 domain-containing protein [Chloroflexi bacterium]|nr:DUF3800 domain-containing protein [Chloroflexota bacterium]